MEKTLRMAGETATNNSQSKKNNNNRGATPQQERFTKMSIKEQVELARKMFDEYSKTHKRLPKKGCFVIKRAKNGKRK